MAGIEELSQRKHQVHIVRQPVNKEAPFEFSFPEGVRVYERNDYNKSSLLQLAKNINPDIIIASGWIDKAYLKVCRAFKGKVNTVMIMDNHWFNNPRQKLMRFLSPLLIHPSYSHIWVPGEPQKAYALKLGYKEANIQTGFYSADVPLFASEAKYRTEAKNFPKRFVFVGRYIKAKGLDILFKAWKELTEELQHDWELWCVGTGDLFEKRFLLKSIKHLGFLQPEQLREVMREAGVFILPSRFEPWGVVVHEMAAAGFPMILSDAIGAATQFLKPDINGYSFRNENTEELKTAIKKIILSSDQELQQMAAASTKLGLTHSPKKWADRLEQLI